MIRALALLWVLSACGLTAPDRAERVQTAEQIGFSGGLKAITFDTPSFPLYGFQRIEDAAQPLHVYIEGDGFAWESRTRPSNDPTPLNPVALRLAVEDDHPNVLWLARPCQYVIHASACGQAMWTSHRFAPHVVAALNSAISQAVDKAQLPAVQLYGYSGGGALAVLVASQRSDVAEIRTVVANLDSEAWVKHHGVTPLRGSLNPASVRNQIATIPQLHVAGAEDAVVPPFIIRDFAESQPPESCAKYEIIDGYGHYAAWQHAWPRLLRTPISCP